MNTFQSLSNMNIARVPPPFGKNMQLQNEFHLQPSSLFVRTRDVTLNYGKAMAKGGGQLPGTA